ncbi:MAG: IS256 family transposase [Chloroflexi bacterium]|nr:IS256 family transposase [Chloroflexota bacterium]
MQRIAPSAQLEEQLAELLSEGLRDGERLTELGRLGARLVIQRGVEEEVTEFLQRARYERTSGARGSRNGTRPKQVQTAEGELTIAMPQVRNADQPFASRLIPSQKGVRTRPLQALVIGSYVRGLSDRDIESLMREAGLGVISKTTVSRICSELRDRYRAFCQRSLAEDELLVLFMDAIYLPIRPSGPKEGVLVAWGYRLNGARVLVSVRLGQRESYEDWLDLVRDLVRRGLHTPWLVVSDGAPGLIKVIGEVWPEADRGRCTVHRLRNVLAKLPRRDEQLLAQVKRSYWAALDQAAEPTTAEQALRQLVADLERRFPSAAACLADDLPALCVHLRYLPRVRRRLRSSNLLERSLGEVRRRTKVIGRFPGETSCLSLCWAVLDLVLDGAQGLALTELERQQLATARTARLQPPTTHALTA